MELISNWVESASMAVGLAAKDILATHPEID